MNKQDYTALLDSTLYDEKTFFDRFLKDLSNCQEEVIIESPYITSNRIKMFYPVFAKLLERNVKIYVITRSPHEHENHRMREQAESEISNFERIGIQPLLCIGNHHRKLTIVDRKILWEGSLNILSQTKSREIMRRMPNKQIALQMFEFLNYNNILC